MLHRTRSLKEKLGTVTILPAKGTVPKEDAKPKRKKKARKKSKAIKSRKKKI